MRWASCFSGIGAPELAWADLWGPPAWVAETDRFCCAVLAHHWPDAPNLGDVAAADFAEKARRHGPVELLIAGTPCQSFSVAGKRLGLDDPRGNLALVYLRVARELRSRWLVFENVPGLLSNWSGATADEIQPGQSGEFIENSDFAAFLGTLRDSGYLGCWRVLDAQHFGVPQRRRRVFVVGYLGDWRPSAAVLFESESLSGHPAPRRKAGEGVADPITASLGKHGGASAGKDGRMRNAVLAYGGNRTRGPIDVATAVNSHGGPHGRQDFESETFMVVPALTGSGGGVSRAGESRGQDPVVVHALTAEGADASEDGTGRGPPLVPVQCDGGNVGTHLPSLRRGDGGLTSGVPAVAFSSKDAGLDAGEVAPTLRAMPHDDSRANAGGQMAIAGPMTVRRLTPRECERLQGLPDDHTRIPWRGRPAEDCPDGPRYRVIGNSMARPVMVWIGRRIDDFEAAARLFTKVG